MFRGPNTERKMAFTAIVKKIYIKISVKYSVIVNFEINVAHINNFGWPFATCRPYVRDQFAVYTHV